MATKKTSNDVEAISPDPEFLTLESGFEVKVDRLRTRGMFKLLKIVTRGAGPILMQADLDFSDTEAFVGQLLAVTVMSIPEAEDEAIDFIRSMVTPAEFNENATTKAEKEKNNELFVRLAEELDDPDPGDTISIIEAIIENEAHDIQALGKRLAAVLKTQMASRAAKN